MKMYAEEIKDWLEAVEAEARMQLQLRMHPIEDDANQQNDRAKRTMSCSY